MAITSLDKLPRKIPKTPKKEEIMAAVTDTVRRVRTKTKGRKNSLVRTPDVDTATIGGKDKTQATKVEDKKTRVGDFLFRANKKEADVFTSDIEAVAQEIPAASFSREANKSSAKSTDRTVEKVYKNKNLFAQGGLNAAVRDGKRGTIFIPNPEQNYPQIVEAFEKRGYRIADTYMADSDGNIILGEDMLPKMVKDLDVRCGDNAVPSGYEDVQMRFEKKGKIFELLVLPGPNYLEFKNKEHEMVYELFDKYKSQGFKDDRGAKEIINAMKEEFNIVTRQLYADAKTRDVNGAGSVTKAVTFTPKGIKKVNDYFKSLKALFAGKHAMLPPSKQKKPFQETKTYQQLNAIEQKLQEFLTMYAPKD